MDKKISKGLGNAEQCDLQIVDQDTTHLRHASETSVFRLIPEVRNPIIGQIFLHRASRTLGSLCLSIVHAETKAISAHDGVQMRSGDPRIDYRIGSLNEDWGFAW